MFQSICLVFFLYLLDSFYARVDLSGCEPMTSTILYWILVSSNSMLPTPSSSVKTYKFMKQTILPQSIFITLNDSREQIKKVDFFRYSRQQMVVSSSYHMVREVISSSSSNIQKECNRHIKSVSSLFISLSFQPIFQILPLLLLRTKLYPERSFPTPQKMLFVEID